MNYAHIFLGAHSLDMMETCEPEALHTLSSFLRECTELFLGDQWQLGAVSPYSFAAYHGLYKLLPLLQDTDRCSHFYRLTALHLAVLGNQPDMVKLLLSTPSCDVNSVAFDGQTPLHFAVKNSEVEPAKQAQIVDLLLRHRDTNVNLATIDNEVSVLAAAIAYGDVVSVEKLIARADLDINLRNKMGDTALHLALPSPTMCWLLLQGREDIDVSATNRWGLTPLDRARRSGYAGVAGLLSCVLEDGGIREDYKGLDVEGSDLRGRPLLRADQWPGVPLLRPTTPERPAPACVPLELHGRVPLELYGRKSNPPPGSVGLSCATGERRRVEYKYRAGPAMPPPKKLGFFGRVKKAFGPF